MRGFFLFFCLIFIPGYSVQQESISLRSKGEPPKLLQHRIQQKLLVSDVSNPWISSASPFRDSPYDAEKTLDGDDIEGMNEEDTGITLTVDDRTFDVINANMGSFVKGAAKDVRGIVDGAANFVHNSIKKTLAPKQRPQKPSKPQKGGSIFDLFGLLPGKNGGNDYNAGNGNKDVSSMINSNYGVPQAPPIVSTTPTPSPNYGIPQAPVIDTATTPLPPSSSYGIPQAPVLTSNPVQPPNSNYGIPQAPPISQNFANIVPQVAVNSDDNYGTNFQDLQDTIGPPLNTFQPQNQPQQQPITTTINPFLRTTTKKPLLSTPAPKLPFSDTIYRPKRNKKLRPGIPPPLVSTTLAPAVITRLPTKNGIINRQKDKDLEEVKLAWYNYYKKAAKYVTKYNERIDVNHFKKPSLRRHFSTTKRAKLSKKSHHPLPFSGKMHLQRPLKKTPYFTIKPSPPKPPTPTPWKRPSPSLSFIENQEHRNIMDSLHDYSSFNYDFADVGILTPELDFDYYSEPSLYPHDDYEVGHA